ncbi:MBL fold metallo-hydrolase [Paenibacillus zanthoxyli]|uniref:MBL fold metallo-hydrolase n=1 Tax=Paenibacillus zanthoxyli TaxID=369399 RepID=UPI00047214EC|nr:MBL fold metallo-hydrolase [Paenibacillus zanthoxyli]
MIDAKTASVWFKITPVGHNVWAIDHRGLVLSYLVVGGDRALLIDTGTGMADLPREVRKLTSLPLIVVNTHGHPDHAGGNYQFPEVFAPVKDIGLMASSAMNIEVRRLYLDSIIEANPEMDRDSFEQWCSMDLPETKLLPLEEGQCIELGDRRLEVIEIPGHSAGNVAFLDSKYKYLFAGDMIATSTILLFLPESTSVEQYILSLEKLLQRVGEFDRIYPGHAPDLSNPQDRWNSQLPLDTGYLTELLACAKQIATGEVKGEVYKFLPVYGDALRHRFGRASIAYPATGGM